jgi:hypothetical protein
VALLLPGAVWLSLSAAQQLGMVVPSGYLRTQLDIHGEGTVLPWYQSLLLAGAAAGAGLCAALPRPQGSPLARRRPWTIVASLLLLASADEVIQLHESLAAGFAALGAPDRVGPVDREWYAFSPVALLLVAARRWLVAVWWARATTGAVLAGVGVWAVALVVDTTHVRELPLKDVLEEGLETLGSALLLVGFWRLAARRAVRALEVGTWPSGRGDGGRDLVDVEDVVLGPGGQRGRREAGRVGEADEEDLRAGDRGVRLLMGYATLT